VKRSFWLVPVAVLSFGALAQEPSSKLGFVSLRDVLLNTVEGEAVLEVREAASEELRGMQKRLEVYNQQAQAGTLSETDRAQQTLLQQAYAQTIRDDQTKLDAAYSSFSNAVDPIIAQTAKEQGFAVVMNADLAASNGLVVYADEATVLTEDVKAKLQTK
jgi:outer membrane protein